MMRPYHYHLFSPPPPPPAEVKDATFFSCLQDLAASCLLAILIATFSSHWIFNNLHLSFPKPFFLLIFYRNCYSQSWIFLYFFFIKQPYMANIKIDKLCKGLFLLAARITSRRKITHYTVKKTCSEIKKISQKFR